MCVCGIFGRLFKEHVLRVRMFNVAAMSVLRFNDLHLSSVVIPKWIYPINKPKRIIQLISVDNVCSFIANGFCQCQWTLDIFVLPLTGFSLVAVFVLNLWKLHFEDNFRQNFCSGIYYGDSLQTNAAFNADAIAAYYKHFFRPDIRHCKCDNVRL